jgi:tetratricopeptide (TPR) repeat protein
MVPPDIIKHMGILLTLILIAFFITESANAQTGSVQASNQESVKTVSEAEAAGTEAVSLFKQRRFDEALPFAEKALKLSVREYGGDHLKTARAYINLGYIQAGGDKKREALKALGEALSIFDKKADLDKFDALTFAGLLESLAALKFADGKDGGAERYLETALELREKFNGSEAAETAATLISLGNLNASGGDHEKAGRLYRRAFDIRSKLGENNYEAYDAFQRCQCSLIKGGKKADAEALQEQFRALKVPNNINPVLPITAGIVNGRALNLVQPRFPQIPAKDRVQQTVQVSVLIDQTGRVVYACGADNPEAHPALVGASEWAAYNSTFSPTLLNGEPVKVTGLIRYSFVKK